MPYRSCEELPAPVRDHLPRHAQEIYRQAFNSAWEQYRDVGHRRGEDSREVVAHKVAWAAVKRAYVKNAAGDWVEK